LCTLSRNGPGSACAPPFVPSFPFVFPFSRCYEGKKGEGNGEDRRRNLLTGVSLCKKRPGLAISFHDTSSIRTLFLAMHLQHVVSYMPNVFNTLLRTTTCLVEHVVFVYKTSHNMTQCTLNISFFSCKTPAARYYDVNALRPYCLLPAKTSKGCPLLCKTSLNTCHFSLQLA